MKIRKILSIVFFILCFSMLFFIPSVKAFDDIDYEFQREVLFNETNPELNLFNMREQQVYNGTYPATDSFTNDIIGGEPFSWTSNNDVNCTTNIISNFGSHKKVLEINDGNNTGGVVIYRDFIIKTPNSIWEFWIAKDSVFSQNRIIVQIKEGVGNLLAYLIFDNNDLVSWNGTSHIIKQNFMKDNTFIHIKLILNDDANTFDTYINGILEGNNHNYFTNSTVGAERFYIISSSSNSDYISYFDGINCNFLGVPSQAYDFSDDTIGTEPEGWTSENTGSATSTIIAGTIDSRSNILQLHNLPIDGNAFIHTSFDFSDNQNFQFDFAKDTYSNDSRGTIVFREGDSNVAILIFRGIHLYNLNLSGETLIYDAFVALDTFYTIFIAFDSISNRFDVYIDGILRKSELPYITDIDSINSVEFFTEGIYTEYKNYYDNVFMNLELIAFGENLQPILETLEGFEGLLETDKYEFSFLNVNTRSVIGSSAFGLWQFDTTGEGFAQIGGDGNLDRLVSLLVGSTAGTANITRTGLSITENLIDVNTGFRTNFGGATHGILEVLLEASDETTITGFKVDLNTNALSYWNGSWNFLTGTIGVSTDYDINLFLNYDIDIVKLEYIVGGTFITNYVFDMVSTGKNGLFEIAIEASIGDGESLNEFEVDYVGVYRNGESWHGELGIITTPINENYHFERHYLYSSIGTGRYHQAIVEGTYVGGETPFQSIKNISTISGIAKDGLADFTNTYEFYWHNFSNANLVLTCIGSDISFTSITIEGSKLIESSNEYFLIYSSGGLDSRESYFYVSSNELRFIHNTSIDDINEFIQAEFNIDDKTSVDTAISFTTNIDFNAFGYFRINFTDDTSRIIIMENTLKTKRFLLTTDKTIESFIILVSDNNNNAIEGKTTGLVKDISLLDIETAIISIVSLNLIDMLIPLIIILLPTLAISGIYGDFLVIPLFILFSLILTITSIIPFWLFFVIGLSSSVFIFFEKDKKGV